MNREYKNLIFTKHALDRVKGRWITQNAVYQVVRFPDKKYGNKDSVKFIKTIKNRKIHVVANYLNHEGKWLIVSVWVRGEKDKIPLVWRLIALPFKIVLWLVKKVVH